MYWIDDLAEKGQRLDTYEIGGFLFVCMDRDIDAVFWEDGNRLF